MSKDQRDYAQLKRKYKAKYLKEKRLYEAQMGGANFEVDSDVEYVNQDGGAKAFLDIFRNANLQHGGDGESMSPVPISKIPSQGPILFPELQKGGMSNGVIGSSNSMVGGYEIPEYSASESEHEYMVGGNPAAAFLNAFRN